MNYDTIAEDENIIEAGKKGIVDVLCLLAGFILGIVGIFFVSKNILLHIINNVGIIKTHSKSSLKDIMMEIIMLILFWLFFTISTYNYFFNNVILTNKSIYIKGWNKIIRYKLEEVEKINAYYDRGSYTISIHMKNGKYYSISYMNKLSAYIIEDEFNRLTTEVKDEL